MKTLKKRAQKLLIIHSNWMPIRPKIAFPYWKLGCPFYFVGQILFDQFQLNELESEMKLRSLLLLIRNQLEFEKNSNSK